jgi:hypothetical protein
VGVLSAKLVRDFGLFFCIRAVGELCLVTVKEGDVCVMGDRMPRPVHPCETYLRAEAAKRCAWRTLHVLETTE